MAMCAPWLSWLQRPTVKCRGNKYRGNGLHNRKVVSSSLTGAAFLHLFLIRSPQMFMAHSTGQSYMQGCLPPEGVFFMSFAHDVVLWTQVEEE